MTKTLKETAEQNPLEEDSLQVFGLDRGGVDVALQKFPEVLQILVSHRHLPLNQQDVLVGMRQVISPQHQHTLYIRAIGRELGT